MGLNELGFRAIRACDYQEAVNIFRRALDKKRDAEGLLGLATAYQRLGELKTARWAFHQVLAIDAHHEKAIAALNELEHAKNRRKPGAPASLFRAVSDYFEFYDHRQWMKILMKAINIDLGLPGYFPGEYPIGKNTYAVQGSRYNFGYFSSEPVGFLPGAEMNITQQDTGNCKSMGLTRKQKNSKALSTAASAEAEQKK
jgi:tetratricopeptide (TPR) repeat protein